MVRRRGADTRFVVRRPCDYLMDDSSRQDGSIGLSAAIQQERVCEGNFVFTHVLLGFWVLAQLVEIGSQLLEPAFQYGEE